MAECITPYLVRDKHTKESVPVPCGKCPMCVARRISQWSFRLMQQERISEFTHFLTLTYDTSKVPISANGYMQLSKRDLQLFFKRLRKAHEKRASEPIRYYAVGEYGGKTKRPHYHVILFNGRIEDVSPAWGNGNIHYGQLTAASVGYTLKYMSKKWRPMHRNDDRLPQFALMSKDWAAVT